MTTTKEQLQDAIAEILYSGSFQEWEFRDWGTEYSICNSCNWNSKIDGGLGHHKNCELKNAINILEEFLEE